MSNNKKVICVEDSIWANDLTIDKVYDVLNENTELYLIINDSDLECVYLKRRFKLVDNLKKLRKLI